MIAALHPLRAGPFGIWLTTLLLNCSGCIAMSITSSGNAGFKVDHVHHEIAMDNGSLEDSRQGAMIRKERGPTHDQKKSTVEVMLERGQDVVQDAMQALQQKLKSPGSQSTISLDHHGNPSSFVEEDVKWKRIGGNGTKVHQQGVCSVGDRVVAVWAGDGTSHPAIIDSISGGKITVNWMDGDTTHREMDFDKAAKNGIPCSPPAQAPCAPGDAVSAVWNGQSTHDAVINSISGGKITVDWNDGDTTHRVDDPDEVSKNGVACSTLQAGQTPPSLNPLPTPEPICPVCVAADSDCGHGCICIEGRTTTGTSHCSDLNYHECETKFMEGVNGGPDVSLCLNKNTEECVPDQEKTGCPCPCTVHAEKTQSN